MPRKTSKPAAGAKKSPAPRAKAKGPDRLPTISQGEGGGEFGALDTSGLGPFIGRWGSGPPGYGSAAVTPDDDNDLAHPTVGSIGYARSLYVTGAGDVAFTGVDGEDDTWTVAAGTVIPVAVSRVKATGTTATGIKAIW